MKEKDISKRYHLENIRANAANSVFGNSALFYFDMFVKDIYSTLKNGAITHIIPKRLFQLTYLKTSTIMGLIRLPGPYLQFVLLQKKRKSQRYTSR